MAAGRFALGRGHRQFVRTVYRGLLHRDPDPAGMQQFVDDLEHGVRTREAVLQAIAESAEAATLMLHASGLRQHVTDFRGFRPRGEDAPRPLLFLHIMKCGGTSLTDALAYLASPWPMLLNGYIDDLVCLPYAMLRQSMLVTGHLPFETIELLAPDTAVCTVLREPVSRTLSHLAHLQVNGHERLTPEEFVFDDAWRSVWHNHQARHLAAELPVAAAWRGEHVEANLQALMSSAELDADGSALRDAARGRLESIEFAGVTDDLTSLVRRLADSWGKPAPPTVERSNVAVKPIDTASLPDRLVREVERGTEVDAELYELARQTR